MDENLIAALVKRGVTTDTFRRLDGEKKERIYRTALRLFGKYGHDGLSVDQMCAESSISKGSFFQYFPSKTHLLEFALLTFDSALESMLARIGSDDQNVLARKRLFHLYQQLTRPDLLSEEEKEFYLFGTNGLRHAAVAVVGLQLERHMHNYVDEVVIRGIRTGEIRGDIDSEVTSRLVSLFFDSVITASFKEREQATFEADDNLISFLFDGIGP